MNASAKNIVVKLYLTAEAYLDAEAKRALTGLSMSALGSLALREYQPAHRMRRHAQPAMPKQGPKRALSFPGRGATEMRRLY